MIPVIALTGPLGAGKTSTLNHLLSRVAIGTDLDPDLARRAIEVAPASADRPAAAGLHRLQRYRGLSA